MEPLLLILVSVLLFSVPVHAQVDGTLEVKVTDRLGTPIPLATIYVQEAGGDWSSLIEVNRTGSEGAYNFTLPPGSYDVKVLGMHDGYAMYNESFAYSVAVADGGYSFVPLKLERYGTLRVRVNGTDNTPVRSEVVIKPSSRSWDRIIKRVITDDTGVALADLPPGMYDVAMFSPGYTEPSFLYNVTVRSRQVVPVNSSLTKLTLLRVQVTDVSSNAISFARVDVKPAGDDWSKAYSSMTLEDKAASFYVPAGIYDVRARGILYEYEPFQASQQQVTLTEGSSVLVQLQLKPVGVTLPARPNLIATKQLDKSEALYKNTVAVTVSIENAGDAQALNVNSVEEIPPGFTVISGQTTWSGDLDVNETVAYSYTLKVPEPSERTTYQLLTSADYYDSTSNAYRAETYAYLSVLPNRTPRVTLLSPNGGELWSGVRRISWAGGDPDGDEVSYAPYYSSDNGTTFVPLASGVTGESYEWNTPGYPDGFYLIKVVASDGKLSGEDTSDSHFRLDNTPPTIGLGYSEKVPDYMQFVIKVNITDISLRNVTFLFNSSPLDYNISESTVTTECLGPFEADAVLNFTVIAEDKAGNIAREEFFVEIAEGEAKLEGEGKVKDDGRSVKVELEAKWRKGEAKGELQLSEKDKDEKERLKAHGKIETLYRDCEGAFRVTGIAKVESGEGKDKVKEDVSFTGRITEEEVGIIIDGMEYMVPAKVKVKEEIREGKT